jgi:hypothetical protein
MSKFKVSSSKSSILSYPTAKPELSLDFVNTPEGIDPTYTFTRNSSATYVGPDGLIKTAAVNQPRFDYDPVTGECKGLLIEKSATNLRTYSEDFSTGWSTFNLLNETSTVLSPNGETFAKKISANDVESFHGINIALNFSIQNLNRVYSFFVKPGEIENICFGLTTRFGTTLNTTQYGFATIKIVINLKTNQNFITTGTSTTDTFVRGNPYSCIKNYGIIDYPNGWKRVFVHINTRATGSGSSFRLYLLEDYSASTSAALFASPENEGLYIWGAQYETGNYPTSYIPTLASTVTRQGDNLSLNNYEMPSQGAILIENSYTDSNDKGTIFQCGDTSLYYSRGHISSKVNIDELKSGEFSNDSTKRLISYSNVESLFLSSHITEYSFSNRFTNSFSNVLNFGFDGNIANSQLNGHFKNFKLYNNFINSTKLLTLVNSKDRLLSLFGADKAVGGNFVYYIKQNGFYYRVHEFTTIGASQIEFLESTEVDYLLVGGGGGGSTSSGRAAGGAGGVLFSSGFINAGIYGIYVGAGGAAGINGENTIFHDIEAIGGGAGGGPGASGGSGGGGNDNGTASVRAGGLGTPGQGNNGGTGFSIAGYFGGGGGGAAEAGQNGSINNGGNGGDGRLIDITGVGLYYGGGGGSHGFFDSNFPGLGGLGGGGDGGNRSTGGNGEPNTGGGGGGSAGLGGSGVVIIRYKV